MLKKSCLLALVAACWLNQMTAQAAEPDKAGGSAPFGWDSSLKASDEELLLFWEEKQLIVESATRSDKPIAQVAENMSVISAKEIEDMNAHTLQDVLLRVTGVYIDPYHTDWGHYGSAFIQGSKITHVSLLLDGVPLNLLSGNTPFLWSVPVQIIDRIEIIKGPASAAWGSALGGVVNVITKTAAGAGGRGMMPSGVVSASYGEGESTDDNVQMNGSLGRWGYYVSAGRQDTEGLADDRAYNNNNVFAKASLATGAGLNLGLSMGYTDLDLNYGEMPTLDMLPTNDSRLFFVRGSGDLNLSQGLDLRMQVYHTQMNFYNKTMVLDGWSGYGAPGDLISGYDVFEKSTGLDGRLLLKRGVANAVLGVEVVRSDLDQAVTAGEVLAPLFPSYTGQSDLDRQAIYANDTLTLGTVSVTPGLRLDHDDITGSFVSPSLGLAHTIAERTVWRTTVARGFTRPSLSDLESGGIRLQPNPDLKPEKVWSFQTGVESGLPRYVWLKAGVFMHRQEDEIVYYSNPVWNIGEPHSETLVKNMGQVSRQGIELEAESLPVHNLTLKAGYVFTRMRTDGRWSDADYDGVDDTFTEGGVFSNWEGNFGLKYDDRNSLMAQLLCHFARYDSNISGDDQPKGYDPSYIWDLHVRKLLYATERTRTELFFSGHNLFDGTQSNWDVSKNPGRWIEGGLRFKF